MHWEIIPLTFGRAATDRRSISRTLNMTRGRAYNICRRKRPLTVREAKRIAGKLNERQAKRVHAYHCPLCDRWHVGADREKQAV